MTECGKPRESDRMASNINLAKLCNIPTRLVIGNTREIGNTLLCVLELRE
jgi:hypothetical protein